MAKSSFIGEFKKFIMRGNVMDMAVGIIIGAAFTKIVNSLVSDVIMPPLGLLLGNMDFSNWFVVLKHGANDSGSYASLAAAQAAGATTLNLGLFINSIISFLIVAFVIFILIRFLNKIQEESDKISTKGLPSSEDQPATKICEYCFNTIPIKAVRCPDCTSYLDGSEPPPHAKLAEASAKP